MVQGFNKIAIIFLIITGCNTQKKTDKKDSFPIVEKTSIEIKKQVSSKKEIKLDSFSKKEKEAVKFLKTVGIIDKSYEFTGAISYKTFKEASGLVSLLTLKYEENLGSHFLEDPVVNILYIKEKENLLDYRIIYTIDDEDFKFSFKKDEIYFFEYYDSSTGWKKNIYYDKGFYQTHRYDEVDVIDINYINFDDKTYRLEKNKKVFEFESIKKNERK